MKKTVSLIITFCICFSCVTFAGAENVDAITDIVTPHNVVGIENVDIISNASGDETMVVLTEDENGTYYLNYSTNAVDYSKIEIGEKLKEHMPCEKDGFSFSLTKLQEIDDVFIVFGYYTVESEWQETHFVFKTVSPENAIVDFTEIEKGEMGGDHHRGYGAYIQKYNDKYIYCFESFEAYENVEYEYVEEEGQYKARNSAYCFYSVSDDLKEWKKYETPSFDSTSLGGTPFFKFVVSEKGILILGFLRWIGSELDSPTIKYFGKTNDFETYENLDISIFDGHEDAPYVFEYFMPDMPNGDILLMYGSLVWEEVEGDNYLLWTCKYYDCYLIDIADGSCEKIISEKSKGDDSLNWMSYSVYPGVGVFLYSKPEERVMVYRYSYDTKTVNKSNVEGEKFYNVRTDLFDGRYAFWNYEDNLTYTVGFGCNGDGNVSMVNYDMSETYLFNVTQTESIFIWNEKSIGYFYSDNDCIAVSLTELLNKLKGEYSGDPAFPPADSVFEAVCPECGESFNNEDEYNRHVSEHGGDENEEGFEFEIRTPSITTVNYGDSLMLHADVTGTLPEDFYIGWSTNNEHFTVDISGKGSMCTISPASSGETEFTATVYDKDGNVVCSDTQKVASKAGFFHKIIAFFKGLFGLTKDYEW